MQSSKDRTPPAPPQCVLPFDPRKDPDALNDYLSTRSFLLGGPEPSSLDAEVFGSIGSPDYSQRPHLGRWFRHLASYDLEERKRFPRVNL